MRKGFTILELLVASLLLGMLVTILTMIFNQSSIAWRTGVAGVSAMDGVRKDVGQVREEADNLIVSGKLVGRITSLWKEDGNLRTRAVSWDGYADKQPEDDIKKLTKQATDYRTWQSMPPVHLSSAESGKNDDTYTIGVTSLGPDPDPDVDYDDITSWPDEIE